jgi:hypothetical protein
MKYSCFGVKQPSRIDLWPPTVESRHLRKNFVVIRCYVRWDLVKCTLKFRLPAFANGGSFCDPQLHWPWSNWFLIIHESGKRDNRKNESPSPPKLGTLQLIHTYPLPRKAVPNSGLPLSRMSLLSILLNIATNIAIILQASRNICTVCVTDWRGVEIAGTNLISVIWSCRNIE